MPTVWPAFDAEFWRNFWPQFIAGVASLVIGIPIALLIANWSLRKTEASTRGLERVRLNSALTAVTNALDANEPELTSLSTLEADKVNYLPALDDATWDVVRDEVVSLLRDPTLQGRLANHFAALRDLIKINDLYISYSTGILSALGGSQAQRQHLHTRLNSYAKAILSDAATLRPLLTAAQAVAPEGPSIPARVRLWTRGLRRKP